MAYSGLTMGSLTDSVNKAYSPRGDAARSMMQFGGPKKKEKGFLSKAINLGGKGLQLYGTATGNPIAAGLGSLASSASSGSDINMDVVGAGLASAYDYHTSPSAKYRDLSSGFMDKYGAAGV
jgi:hypothetical protein